MNNEAKCPGQRTVSKRNTMTAAMFLLWMFLGWYAGTDYSERGSQAAVNLLVSIFAAAGVFFIPIWTKDGNFKW